MSEYKKEWEEVRGALYEFIYIDTTEYRSAQFNLNSTRFSRFMGHIRASNATILLTPILEKEIAAGVLEAVDLAANALKSARRNLSVLTDLSSWNSGDIFQRPPKDKIANEIKDRLWHQIKSHKHLMIGIRDVILEKVLELYFKNLPPFGEGKKRKEFPDAIAFLSLEEWANKNRNRIAIISGDADFGRACTNSGYLDYFPSITDFSASLLAQSDELEWLESQIWEDSDWLTELAEIAIDETPKTMIYPEGAVIEHAVRSITWMNLKLQDKQICDSLIEYRVALSAEVDSEAVLGWDDYDPGMAHLGEYPYSSNESVEHFRDRVEFTAIFKVDRETGEIEFNEMKVCSPEEFELSLKGKY